MSLPVLLLAGPTACRKSELSIELCEEFDCELVSVDSVMVYRGMDIGADKPSVEQRCRVPHHLLDIRDPRDPYSVADFCTDARMLINAIHQRGRLPLLSGGTMLYFHCLLEGMSKLPPADPTLRTAIECEAQEHGWEALHRELQQVDPQSAARIHPRHSRRLQRALEVWRLTGTPLSRLQNCRENGLRQSGMRLLECALLPPPAAEHRQRITQRLQRMFDKGLEAEVRSLMSLQDPTPTHSVRAAVGYRQFWEGLCEGASIPEIRLRIERATHVLVRRQMNWIRRWSGVNTFASDCHEQLRHAVRTFL